MTLHADHVAREWRRNSPEHDSPEHDSAVHDAPESEQDAPTAQVPDPRQETPPANVAPLPGWADAADFAAAWTALLNPLRSLPEAAPPTDDVPEEVPPESAQAEPTAGSIRTGLRAKLSAYAERRRVNRAFRRNQREFESVMDACVHDPACQRELQTIWSIRP